MCGSSACAGVRLSLGRACIHSSRRTLFFSLILVSKSDLVHLWTSCVCLFSATFSSSNKSCVRVLNLNLSVRPPEMLRFGRNDRGVSFGLRAGRGLNDLCAAVSRGQFRVALCQCGAARILLRRVRPSARISSADPGRQSGPAACAEADNRRALRRAPQLSLGAFASRASGVLQS